MISETRTNKFNQQGESPAYYKKTMDNKECIEKVRKALENNKCFSTEFHKDGSGVSFHIIDMNGDHGLSCHMAISLSIGDAIQCISGFRFEQYKSNISL